MLSTQNRQKTLEKSGILSRNKSQQDMARIGSIEGDASVFLPLFRRHKVFYIGYWRRGIADIGICFLIPYISRRYS